ncbi:putative aldo-keto reductase family protein [Cryphonectria parasitica EP155]|uniref:Aldo-keto reductase family protein n=1 Tax=Cryphonectria parasitica (strain ATCC 38755 / EP155) TaxID=660469 RepID=A0A9P4YCW7_CRYP1|nr:putative aldo-keto reductase family protein [Cryphonectria parasitica EP155]KAF3771043.1 putative aldo-keto reductase family protein [Cryphonectria parasitica EP155]
MAAAATGRFSLRCARESAGTIPLPNLCIGSWSWGDNMTWKNASASAVKDLDDAWRTMAQNDLFFVDTAEVYGSGESERIIGRLRSDAALTPDDFRTRLVLASKFLPIPWPPTRLFPSKGMVNACRGSLQRMGLESMDLYQVHGPIHVLNSIDSMAGALARCVELGLTRAVGVSNYSLDEMVRMDEALKKRGYRLASNQVEFSLLRTRPETTGLLAECKARGIVLMAYSPLGMGRLTGKYTKDNPPPSGRKFGDVPIEELAPLLETLRTVGEKHGVKPSAVALKWVIQKGAIPLGGVKNAKQAEENARAASEEWMLSDEEMAELDQHAREGTTSFWQHD